MTKIAIVRRNGLGDLLCTVPLINYLIDRDPSVKLTLFVDEGNSPLLSFLPRFGETVIFPKKGNKYFNILKFGLSYRKMGFDVAISAKTSPMKLMNLFLFFLGAKKRVAYVDGSWHCRFVNSPISYQQSVPSKLHQALKTLHTVEPDLKEVPEKYYPHLHVPASLKMRYAPFFKTQNPRLLISASTTREANRFDPKRYATLVNRLYHQHPFELIFVSQHKDQLRAQEIASYLTIPYSLHFPRNFDEFMVLLDVCDFYFVGDGGIAHIGAALNKKEVVLFGESDPAEWSPLGKGVESIYDPIHVNRLCDEMLFELLKEKRTEVACGRENL